jgi:prepilin-type processing-associated H-X9-DG protein/prepilin-type N-terminal cleavage/methylation domain-containing protein
MSSAPRTARPRAFTLVELLVVIGIIALLISILMPSLSRAREQANLVKCMSNLRQVGTAMMMHATEHRNYVPLGGLMYATPTPAGLGDAAMKKYSYYSDGGTLRPMPIPAALAPYLGQTLRSDTVANLQADMDSGPVRDVFTCPTQGREGINRGSMLSDGSWTAPLIWSSYVFNEEPIGFWDDASTGYKRGRGNLNRIRGASEVMFIGDGKPRGVDGWLVMFSHGVGTVLEDVWRGSQLNTGIGAGDRTAFDLPRHKNRMNVLFMDGHAETIIATLKKSDPNEVKFSQTVYLTKYPY